MSRNIYVGLFFLASNYSRGIDSTIAYFNSLKPGNTVVIEKYIVDGTPALTLSCLNDFLTKYPTGDRATVSVRTSIISVLSTELQTLGLDIPCFSITATSNLMKTLPNSLTYAPFDQYSAMNNFMIYKQYQMKHLKALYEPDTLDDAFFQSYISLLQTQGALLGITVEVDTLVLNKNYNLQPDTAIVYLSLNYSFVNASFLSQIPSGSYISMTDANDDCLDIFGNVPAFVILPTPIDYTSTSQNVYDALTDKTNFLYNIYGFFDILYTIENFTQNSIPFTLDNYVTSNPFTTIPSAFGYISWNLNINGSNYGIYDSVFTKDSVIGNEKILFNLYNDGGLARLPQSQSVFLSFGIAPFFSSKLYYNKERYVKIYNQNKELIIVRFEKNTTKYLNNIVIVSQELPCNFICNYTQDGFFSYLQPLFSICGKKLVVNSTMSKDIVYEILFENNEYNQETVNQLKLQLCDNNCPPCPPNPPCPPIPPCPPPYNPCPPPPCPPPCPPPYNPCSPPPCPPPYNPCHDHHHRHHHQEQDHYSRSSHQSNCRCRKCKY